MAAMTATQSSAKRRDSKQMFDRTVKEMLRAASNVEVRASTMVGGYIRLPTDDVQRTQDPEDFLDVIFHSNLFQGFMTVLIMLNAILIGLETDMPDAFPWAVVENTLLVVFTVELWLNVRSQGGLKSYFSCEDNPEINWNMFDFLVVSFGIVDLLATHLFKAKSPGATVFRICRLLRILRLVRIFKFLKKLFLLAVGFVEAVQALAWTTILIFVALYMCSILMVRTVGRLPDDDPHSEFLHNKFSDVRTSMLTLFVLMASTDLPVWVNEDNLVWDRPGLLCFLVAFVLIGSFGMLALLTGVVNESMFEKNQVRLEEARKEAEQLHVVLDSVTNQVFEQLELDEDGCAKSSEVVRTAMPMIAAVFHTMGVDFDRHALADLVIYMDTDGSGSIDKDEFAKAVTSFARGVNTISIQEVLHAVHLVTRKVTELERTLCDVAGIQRKSKVRASMVVVEDRQDSVAEFAGAAGLEADTWNKDRASKLPGEDKAVVENKHLEPKLSESSLVSLRDEHERYFRAMFDMQASIQRDLQQMLRSERAETFEGGSALSTLTACWKPAAALPPPRAAPPASPLRIAGPPPPSTSISGPRAVRLAAGAAAVPADANARAAATGVSKDYFDRRPSPAAQPLLAAGHPGDAPRSPHGGAAGCSRNCAAAWPEVSPQTEL